VLGEPVLNVVAGSRQAIGRASLLVESAVAAGHDASGKQRVHQFDGEPPAEVVVAVAGLADRVGAGTFAQGTHASWRGVLGQRFQQQGDSRASEPVVAMATVRLDLDETSIEELAEVLAGGRRGHAGLARQDTGRKGPTSGECEQHPASGPIAEQRPERGDVGVAIHDTNRRCRTFRPTPKRNRPILVTEMSATDKTEDTATRNADSTRRVVFAVMCAGYFLVLLDVTIVNVALPRIGSALHAGVSSLQWVVDGYALALASLMLGGGTVGDLHGHKRVVLAGMSIFGIASVGCGLAPSTGALVAFRVAQGAGAALMLPGTLAVIANAYRRDDERARAIGIWAGIGSVALPAGPILGGALIGAVGWRAIFFLNVPIVAVATVIAARTVRESADPQGRSLDLSGTAFAAGLLALSTYALIEAGHSGLTVSVSVAAIVAVGLALAFYVVERSREHPMLPLSLFHRPTFSASNAIAGAMNLSTLGLLFLITLYLQDVRHHSALLAGVALLPLFLPLGLIAPLGGRLTARTGPRSPMLIGLLLAAAGVALLARLGSGSSYLSLLPALLLWGIGLALLTPAVVAAAINAVPGERPGLASAVNNTARQAGGAIGIAAFGALAGAPSSDGFVGGLHLAALIAAALFVLSSVATIRLVPRVMTRTTT
jgi:MFS transporter, DHA2 family, methylenomycin A resistance protein